MGMINIILYDYIYKYIYFLGIDIEMDGSYIGTKL